MLVKYSPGTQTALLITLPVCGLHHRGARISPPVLVDGVSRRKRLDSLDGGKREYWRA